MIKYYWAWVLLALFAVAVSYILIALTVESLGELSKRNEDPYAPIACVQDVETKEKIRNILFEATEEALKKHVVKMHEVWMSDARGQPERATNGVRQGIRAFIGGREFLQKWDPPIC